jgi:ribonuclease-3
VPPLVSLQQRLQHAFSNPALLTRALTHRSASSDHNERLEFLGDSVLNLAVSSLLYERLASQPRAISRACVPTWSSKTPCTDWP